MQVKASWTEQARVDRVVRATGCTEDEARGYLIAEEGDEKDAILSVRADRSSWALVAAVHIGV
jgi:hypothetical protein